MTTSTAARAEPWTGRVEDEALLRGEGRFGDDVKPQDALAACFVRSPHGFAEIERIDASAAKSAPGVVAVLTAADLASAHYHSLTHAHPIPGRGGKPPISPHRPALAQAASCISASRSRMVLAESVAQAQDAADWWRSNTESLRPSPTRARRSSRVRRSSGRKRPAISASTGRAPADPDGKKQAALERAFAQAAHVVKVELVNQRLVVASLEARSATASYDAAAEQIHAALPDARRMPACAMQSPPRHATSKPDALHVVTDDVGGAFGMKGAAYPEYTRAAARRARGSASRCIGCRRRAEAFVTDTRAANLFWTRGARAQRARPLSGLARRLSRQCGRLHDVGRAFLRDHAYLRLPADGLRHSARAGEHALRLHQHAADRALSRRRPPGGELSDRARDRRRRRQARHRSGRIAPAQPDRAGENPLHHRLRQYL